MEAATATVGSLPDVSAARPQSLFEQSVRQMLSARLAGLGSTAPHWETELRRTAVARLDTVGMPNTRHEAWKYINMVPVLNHQVGSADTTQATQWQAAVQDVLGPLAQGPVWWVLDGVPLTPPPVTDTTSEYPLGLVFSDFATAAANGGWPADVLRVHAGQSLRDGATDASQDAMALLNGGLYDNGWLVTIPDNMAVACPITVVCVTTAKADAGRARPFINTRGLVHLESGAKATMRVVWVDLSPQEDKPASFAALHNTAIEVALHPGAQLTLSLHQHNPQTGVAHFVHTDANLQRESCLTLNTLALSGALTRFAAGVQYIEPQAQCILNGLSLLTGQTQTHHHTRVVHRLPACQTDQMYRGMALDQTRLEFDGTIHVDPDAQQTQAVQVNNNLLLSEQARVWSRPQLKIDADDVKCAHGATVGQLDETALFYCRSRGLGPEDARRLLLQGFAGAVLSRVEDTALVARVYEHLKAIL